MRPWLANLLASAKRNGLLRLFVTVVPMSSMVTVLATVSICYHIWRTGPSGRSLRGVVLPAISELGVDLPQRWIYQVGFALCAGLFSFSTLCFEELLEPHLLVPAVHSGLQAGAEVRIIGIKAEPTLNETVGTCETLDEPSGRWIVRLSGGEAKAFRSENLEVTEQPSATSRSSEELRRPDAQQVQLWDKCMWWGHAAAVGAGLQGIVTLERQLSLNCVVHWGGAILFMSGAMQHAKASNELFDIAAAAEVPLVLSSGVRLSRKLRHLILDYSSAAVFLVTLLVQVLPRSAEDEVKNPSTSGENMPMDPRTMNMMGLMQWAIIFQFAVYFCSYTMDMRAAADSAEEVIIDRHKKQ